METNKNYIDECLEEFGNIINQHNKIDINRISYSLCEDIETFLKQKLQKAIDNKVEEIREEIEKQDIVKDKVGSFYDGYICFKDQILYYLKNK